MILRSVETRDENKARLIDQKVDVTQINDRYYLFFPSKELTIEIDNPFDKEGMLTNEYYYEEGNTAWFKVKSYDTVYTIEVETNW